VHFIISLFLVVDHMEYLSKTESPSVSDIPHLRHRVSVPDVPEDVQDELLLHFNDPNWDFHPSSSTLSISSDGVERRRSTDRSVNKDFSTDLDTESRLSSSHIRDSKGDFSSDAIPVQWVFLPCHRHPCCIFSSALIYQRFTVPRGAGSRREHRRSDYVREYISSVSMFLFGGRRLIHAPSVGGSLVCFSP
jgi:hypothetical protein